MHTNILVALLAGGRSRRMGVDKANLIVEGETLLEKVAQAALGADLPVWIVGRANLNHEIAVHHRITTVPDEVPGLGPLGGLATVLRQAPEGTSVLLSACDLPLVTSDNFKWLASIANARETAAADGIIPSWRGLPEPLFAVYRHSVLPMIDRHIKAGRLSMQDLVATGAFVQVPLLEEHCTAIKDADTPDEFKDLLRGF